MVTVFIQFADGRTSRATDVATIVAAARDPGGTFLDRHGAMDRRGADHPRRGVRVSSADHRRHHAVQPAAENRELQPRRRRLQAGLFLHGHTRSGPGNLPRAPSDQGTRHFRFRTVPDNHPRGTDAVGYGGAQPRRRRPAPGARARHRHAAARPAGPSGGQLPPDTGLSGG